MIRYVAIEGRDDEEVRLRIAWNGDGPDSPLIAPLSPRAQPLIADMADDGMTPDAIAERLNSIGLRTLKGNAWTKATVYASLRNRRLRGQEQ